jgi:hypothetical protein
MWGWEGLLNKKGILGLAAALLLRCTPLPGKRYGKIALSSSNDRSRKNQEFPYAENYAGGSISGMNYRRLMSSPILFFK